MYPSSSASEASRPFLTWQRIIDWAQEHYRYRTFSKDERIPARTGLLYLVQRGAIRLVGTSQVNATSSKSGSQSLNQATEEAFLGLGLGKFHLIKQPQSNGSVSLHVPPQIWHSTSF